MTQRHAMSDPTCRELILSFREEYLSARRARKSEILAFLVDKTDYDGKYLSRLLHGKYKYRSRRKRRGPHYGPEFDAVLREVFESHDAICAERIHPNLLSMAEHLALHNELVLTPKLRQDLAKASLSTVRRHWTRLTQDEPRLLRPKPRPINEARRQIPMRRIPWNEQCPGHFEVDLVHHCGPAAQGDYVHTLQMVDVATGWSELRAVLGRSYRVMSHAFDCILNRLPFALLELHPDNGSEFFNDHLLRFWGERAPGLKWSRSRPYHKNDNRFVEQRNGDLVRGYVGYDRLDTVAQTQTLNELYDLIWLYFNFFQPVRRLASKEFSRVEGGFKLVRHFDPARTPLQRLLATNILEPEQAAALYRLYERTNPKELRARIYAMLERLFTLSGATPGITEDIFETLTPISHREEEAPTVTMANESTIALR